MTSYQNTKSRSIPDVFFKPQSHGFELEIVDLYDLQQQSPELSPRAYLPHRVNFNLLIIIEKGSGEHLIDFEKVNFDSGSVLFLNKNQMQAFDFSNKLEGRVILYTEKFLDSLQASMGIPFSLSANMPKTFDPHVSCNSTLKRSLDRLTDELMVEISRDTPALEITMSLFGTLLMLLARERNNPIKDLHPLDTQKFVSFHKLVENHGCFSRDASFYANKLGISYKTLNLLCKKVVGQTAKSHIDHHIVLEAKRRLIIDQSNVATLAHELGFKETTNFTKFFKRYTQTTPHQYRKDVRY